MVEFSLKKIVEDRIKGSDGKNFQKLCWDILLKLYPDFQPVKMDHDMGNDGYSLRESLFFACYAPEKEYKVKETIKKITEDYRKFNDNWAFQGFKNWIFVTKEDLQGKPHQVIVELNNNGDDIKKENWGITKLIEKIFSLPEEKIKEIFKIQLPYKELADTELKEMGIINEIFDYALLKIRLGGGKNFTFKAGIHLNDKIILNFPNEREKKDIRDFFLQAYEKLALIQKIFQEIDPDLQKDCHAHIKDKYIEYKRSKIASFDILQRLVRDFTPRGREDDSQYTNLSRAFVLFFFDDCTIFEKTKEENNNS